MLDGMELGEFDIDSVMREAECAGQAVPDEGKRIERQVVFAIDASNSMQGYKLGAVNDTVNNVLAKLKSLDRGQNNSVSVSVLGFSTRLFRWTSAFVPIAGFQYSYVEMADGLTDMNALLQELSELTARHMHTDAKKYVVLFSDGLPTEAYSESMARWMRAEQYKDITKIAVAFDEDLADPQSMAFFHAFVDGGAVLSIKDQGQLLAMLMD